MFFVRLGLAPFTSPPPPPFTGPKGYIERAMGMLEGLLVKTDPKKEEALDRVFLVLKTGSAEETCSLVVFWPVFALSGLERQREEESDELVVENQRFFAESVSSSPGACPD